MQRAARRVASLSLRITQTSSRIHFHRSRQNLHLDLHRLSQRFTSVATHRQVTLSDSQQRTIYALSTPPGKAGVAIIRISGPDVLQVWKELVRSPTPTPWRMYRCRLVHPRTNKILDDALCVYFRGPKSFTTEDVLELHIHSGRAIISSVLNALASIPLCRPAEPGEFTRRAFIGGRLDLTQVEGLKDLIDAETEGQRLLALQAAGGATRARFEALRNQIIKCLASVEALIDFGEGEDIEEGVYEQAREQANQVRTTIQKYLQDNRQGEIVRSGIRLAIFGPPNAGKSSLLNFLAQREAAIVTHVPGTTRDILELSLDIGGLPIIVSDTAGLRKTHDLVENIGVERAQNAVAASNVSLCVLSLEDVLARNNGLPNTKRVDTSKRLLDAMNIPSMIKPLITPDTFVLFNKADLLNTKEGQQHLADFQKLLTGSNRRNSWVASLSMGEGMNEFLEGFTNALKSRFEFGDESGSSAQAPIITRARHRVHLENALRFVEAFLDTPSEDVVLGAEELRYAAKAVGKISGAVDVEEVLDSIFRDFCIGK